MDRCKAWGREMRSTVLEVQGECEQLREENAELRKRAIDVETASPAAFPPLKTPKREGS